MAGLIKRRTRKQRRMHGAALTTRGRRWTQNGMRLRNRDGRQVWVYSHNESEHSPTKRKVTKQQRRRRRQIAAASRRRNRTR